MYTVKEMQVTVKLDVSLIEKKLVDVVAKLPIAHIFDMHGARRANRSVRRCLVYRYYILVGLFYFILAFKF